jgi:hypothetical protein
VGGKLVADRLAVAGEFHQRFDVFELACDFKVELKGFLDAGALLIDLTGALLIRPEVRLRDDLLQVVELAFLSRSVKGTSALPRYGFSRDQTGQ